MNLPQRQTAENLLARVLRSPVAVTRVGQRHYTAGPGAHDEVVTTCRLILLLAGSMRYTVEGRSFVLEAGTQIFVPAWTRRMWSTPLEHGCEIAWCEFDDDPVEFGPGHCFCRTPGRAAFAREKRALAELARLWQAHTRSADDPLLRLGLEAALKPMLARFWQEAAPVLAQDGIEQARPPHPQVRQALRWLEEHFCEPDALARLEAACGLTPNYFRERFREAMMCTPGEYLQRLRLRRARYLIHATGWQHKRIAAEVGYADPLYFSRLYRRFWGHPPSAELSAKDSPPTSGPD
ncbi:helix-turn-helix transcriptional regulator [Ruficoccus amylovorans]|uniref:Helix-turn-helix transcriptional regulator n=1 Tax=Ruficoccus amylovorans TaxID=1804625 RepID=A0A842HIT0_9BACT|nr:AraC family transcriptional regulator [Ruficoccus amylovorans]MBC2595496.1 helix-turn-helix transcriptional regulator [Ruficoccus amylovorans]